MWWTPASPKRQSWAIIFPGVSGSYGVNDIYSDGQGNVRLSGVGLLKVIRGAKGRGKSRN